MANYEQASERANARNRLRRALAEDAYNTYKTALNLDELPTYREKLRVAYQIMQHQADKLRDIDGLDPETKEMLRHIPKRSRKAREGEPK
jgi:hypothetical protein